MPLRVVELAKKVTDGKKTDFDKVKAIESFLVYNYAYDQMPGPLPQGRDFVDYFLFDSRKGHCTYYATSMVMMVRSIGIPARYIDGYRVDRPAKSNHEIYIDVINSESLHSWPEVYFEGVGWVNFEPTTADYENFYSDVDEKFKGQFRDPLSDSLESNFSVVDKPASEVIEIKSITPEPQELPSGEPTTIDKPEEDDKGDGQDETTNEPTVVPTVVAYTFIPDTVVPDPDATPDPSGIKVPSESGTPGTTDSPYISIPQPENDEKSGTMPKILLFAILVIIIIAGWIAYSYQRLNRIFSGLNNMENRKSVIQSFSFAIKLIGKLGYKLKATETPYEFMLIINKDDMFERLPIEKAFDIFVRARYSANSIPDQDKAAMLEFCRHLDDLIRDKKGNIKYYIYRLTG